MAEVVLEAICQLLAALFELGSGLPPLKPKPGMPSVPQVPAKRLS
jgi:hypothetical protein